LGVWAVDGGGAKDEGVGVSGEDGLLACELGAAVEGERIGGGVFEIRASAAAGSFEAVEDVVCGEEGEGDVLCGASEGERAEVVGGGGPGVVGLAALDVGGAGGAVDGGDVVLGEDGVEECGVGGDLGEVDVQPVG
jgi:hypothetical protein